MELHSPTQSQCANWALSWSHGSCSNWWWQPWPGELSPNYILSINCTHSWIRRHCCWSLMPLFTCELYHCTHIHGAAFEEHSETSVIPECVGSQLATNPKNWLFMFKAKHGMGLGYLWDHFSPEIFGNSIRFLKVGMMKQHHHQVGHQKGTFSVMTPTLRNGFLPEIWTIHTLVVIHKAMKTWLFPQYWDWEFSMGLWHRYMCLSGFEFFILSPGAFFVGYLLEWISLLLFCLLPRILWIENWINKINIQFCSLMAGFQWPRN